ncbi:MAG: MarR family winged helix-turn-helix transcriptional regulator [Gemmatimonadota bacterium]
MQKKRDAGRANDEALRDTMRAIRSLVALLGQSARTVEHRTGVTNAQLFVLQLLADGVPHSINEIAALALTHQSAVSIIVSRLERAGLVSRTRSAEDARRVDVAITAAGRKLARKAPAAATTRLLDALKLLPKAELRRLAASLGTLSTALGIDADSEPMMLFEPTARAQKHAK